MTTDEALIAIRKAVELLPDTESNLEIARGMFVEKPDWQSLFAYIKFHETILAALHALSPDGPLVAVPREPLSSLVSTMHMKAEMATGRKLDTAIITVIYRAMIEAASKP